MKGMKELEGILIRDCQVSNLDDEFEEMKGYAIDAYRCQRGTEVFGAGDFSQEARELAARTVASHFGVSVREALAQFEICIVPGIGFHGKIMAKQR